MIEQPTIEAIVFYGALAIVGLIVLIVANVRKDRPRSIEDLYDPYRYCPKEEED